MWVTEFLKRFYFKRYPKQVFITRLELCGMRDLHISPFIRNLYILTGKIGATFTEGKANNHTLFRYSGVLLWLFGNMDSHGDREEFRRSIETTFSGRVSTHFRLFQRHIIEPVQPIPTIRGRLHMSKYRWLSSARGTVSTKDAPLSWGKDVDQLLEKTRESMNAATIACFNCFELNSLWLTSFRINLAGRSSVDTLRRSSVSFSIIFTSLHRIGIDGLAWLIMYIHVSWSWRHLGILAYLFQVGLAVLAFYIGQ